MSNYIPALMNFKPENIRTETLPGVPEYCNGVAVYLVNETKSKN